MQALSDHLSYPDDAPVDVVTRHLPGYPFRSSSATVACVLYNVTKRQVTVCKGPPCQGVFETFELGGEGVEEEGGGRGQWRRWIGRRCRDVGGWNGGKG